MDTKRSLIILIALGCAMFVRHSAPRAEWQVDGTPVCTAAGDKRSVASVTDGLEGAIIVWLDYRNGEWDIFARRIDAGGNVLWAPGGVPVCTAPNLQRHTTAVSDGTGGAIIAWADLRSDAEGDIYTQRIDMNGTVQWTADGVAICVQPNCQAYPSIVSDGAGGAIVTWFDERPYYDFQYYSQRIDHYGNIKWQVGGVPACSPIIPEPSIPVTVPDSAGGATFVWVRYGGFLKDNDIQAAHIDSTGAMDWNVPVCTESATQFWPAAASDGAGGAIITWQDFRYSILDIYAQRLDRNGTPRWAADGIPILVSPENKERNAIIADGAGGAIILWREQFQQMHAQRIDSSGALLWGPEGVDLGEVYPRFCSDESGGMITAWGTDDIHASRITDGGVPSWECIICDAPGEQTCCGIIPDGAGGAIITWLDFRSGDATVYASRIDADGDIPVAVLLQDFAALPTVRGITITWTLLEAGDDIRFHIARCVGTGGRFEEIAGPEIVRAGCSFTYIDNKCEPCVLYRYRVEVSDGDGRRALFETDPVFIPAMPLKLYGNHPNPFNPSTVIEYYLPDRRRVIIDIYDTAGRPVIRLLDCEQPAGRHALEWNGMDSGGDQASSGVYLCTLKAGKEMRSRKLVLLR